MRSAVIAAGLVAVVAADPKTVTETADVTVTYCAPSVTNCVVGPTATNGWENWQTAADPGASTWAAGNYGKPPAPPAGASTWSSWDPSKPKPTGWTGAGWESAPVDGSSTWVNVPADGASTWANYDPKPTTWANVPEDATSTWANVPVDAASTWVNYPVKPTPVDAASTWVNVPVKPTPVDAASTWATWANVEASTVTAPCPKYTATGPPSWFTNLPSEVASSLGAKWTGAPPSDWCYYSYSTTVPATSTVWGTASVPAASTWATASVLAASTWGTASVPAAASSTGAWSNVDSYKGAANANSGSMAMAGLAGLAAIMFA